MFRFPIVIQPSEIESTYNHVHHATIFTFLERGRIEFLKSHGIDYDALVARGVLMPIVTINVQFKKELTLDEIVVTCGTPEVQSRGIMIPQQILLRDETIAVEALVHCVWVSARTRCIMRQPVEFRVFAQREV